MDVAWMQPIARVEGTVTANHQIARSDTDVSLPQPQVVRFPLGNFGSCLPKSFKQADTVINQGKGSFEPEAKK